MLPKMYLFFLPFILTGYAVAGQSTDSIAKKAEVRASDKFSLLLYTRTISDAHGNYRFDQNIVPNFRVTPWLRMEIGFRQGERTNQIGAYNHYKLELQSRTLFRRFRLIARMSDNVVRYGSPTFSRTNYLVIVESKYPLGKKFELVANVGYVYTYQKNNVFQGEPIIGGTNDNHGIYKFGVRYKLHDKGFLEGVLGTYDVFNPYQLSQPFVQAGCDYELFDGGTLYSYFRYQYDKSFATSFNDFLGLGVRLRIRR